MRLFNVFRKHAAVAFFGRPGVTLLLLLSIASALFCVDAIDGYGNGRYYRSVDNIYYQCFSLTDLNNNSTVCETDIREYLAERYEYDANAVLYFTRHEDPDDPFGEYLIVGYDSELALSRWWAGTSGRNVFTSQELSDGARVAYISDSAKAKAGLTDSVKIDGVDYQVIGTAFFVDYNIKGLLPSSEADELMPTTSEHGLNFRRYYVLPYRTYETAGYRPDFILVKMNGMTTAQVRDAADAVFEDFKGISGTYPPLDTTDLKSENDVRYGIYGSILCIGAWLGAIGIFSLWVKSQSKKAWVFMACGLSRKKLMCYACIETLLIAAGAKLISWLVCTAFDGQLKQLKVMTRPFSAIPMSALAVTAAASAVIVIVNISRMTRTQKNYE